VDTRLRPDGSKGLLVGSLDAFIAYQQSRAWTWEHQALLRARPVAGDAALGAALAAVRRDILGASRERAVVIDEVSQMRRRWRAERDRSDAQNVDLKQGRGALLDIEFALQGLVLAHAAQHPALLGVTSNVALLAACRAAGLLDAAQSAALAGAHATLLQRSLACTLDARPRIAPRDAAQEALCDEVAGVTRALGFAFD
jgi:glutamate-ammonia-ligase adenylyltransferase